jgi:hypothetical protein
MAHPMNEHRSHKHERDRVSKITGQQSEERTVGGMCGKMRARGGKVDAPAKTLRAEGGEVKARADKGVRRARGGRTGKKASGKTNVNVIVAPGHGAGGPGMGAVPPPGGMPPMPPKPPMAAPPPPTAPGGPPVAGLGGMPPGGPPIPHAMGGRAYKKGGAVKMSGEKKHGKHEKPYKMRATGGFVGKKSNADVKGVTGVGLRTPIQHSGNKSDTQNIGRKAPITKATGGPITSEALKKGDWPKAEGGLFSEKAPKSPKFGGGSGGGTFKKQYSKRYNPAGHQPWTKDYAT